MKTRWMIALLLVGLGGLVAISVAVSRAPVPRLLRNQGFQRRMPHDCWVRILSGNDAPVTQGARRPEKA
jgi:hypothetical protein